MSYTLEKTEDGVDLIVMGDWSREMFQSIECGQADGLVLNYARGFREKDLRFIEGLPIRRLNLLAREMTDLSPIYSLADRLQVLLVQASPTSIIELERLPLLQTLSAGWSQVQGSILYASQLQNLSVHSYTEVDLSPLSALTRLVKLVMKERPRLQSLDGLEMFPWIQHLGIHLASTLSDISALGRSRPTLLQVLQLQACRRIIGIEPVVDCSSLQFFDLSEGGEVSTIEPLGGLVGLERVYLYESTRVVDGDLSPIAQLPRLKDFRMMNRRHYSPSVKEIQDVIARRIAGS